MFLFSNIMGGLFLFFVFYLSDTKELITTETVQIIYSVFTGLTVIGIIIFLLLRQPPEEHAKKAEYVNHKERFGENRDYLIFKSQRFIFCIVSQIQ